MSPQLNPLENRVTLLIRFVRITTRVDTIIFKTNGQYDDVAHPKTSNPYLQQAPFLFLPLRCNGPLTETM